MRDALVIDDLTRDHLRDLRLMVAGKKRDANNRLFLPTRSSLHWFAKRGYIKWGPRLRPVHAPERRRILARPYEVTDKARAVVARADQIQIASSTSNGRTQ